VKADLTRKSLNPLKHFSQVLNQQGRVQLDADWNEQGGILLHVIRQIAADGFGPAATSPQNGGFTVVPLQLGGNLVPNDFAMTPGTYYVDGILCELNGTPVPVTGTTGNTATVANWTVDATPFAINQYVRLWNDTANPGTQPPAPSPQTNMPALAISQVKQTDYADLALTLDSLPSGLAAPSPPWNFIQRITSYLTQPDLPNPPDLSKLLASPNTSGLVYLDVWERLITSIEDDSIREVALNGPDTCARARVVWQAKVLPNQTACITPGQLTETLQPWTRGYLRAQVSPTQISTDPCTISPTSQYRGAENQLYRVEIHTGNFDVNGNPTGGTPSFKWSRENGSVVFQVLKIAPSTNTTVVTLSDLGRDDRFGLEVGDYVELQNDTTVLNNLVGNLLQVQSIDTTSLTVTLAGTTATVDTNPSLHPLLRRWDHRSGDPTQGGETVLPDGALPIPTTAPAQWIDLEDGVQVRFEILANVSLTYRSGDYWLIPARVATGNVIWPTETVTDSSGNSATHPAAMPPDGITHHYAPLAVLTLASGVASISPCPAPARARRTAQVSSPPPTPAPVPTHTTGT
jgi:Family of unknown function (DUF6519)